MKNLLLFFALTMASLQVSAFELTESCRQNVLKSLKTRQIEVSSDVYRGTGGNLAPFVGVACDNVPLNVRSTHDDRNQKIIVITATVNPWHGPSRSLTVNCDRKNLKKLPVVEVTVRQISNHDNCNFKISNIKSIFDLND